jgi:hypothetical protein
MPYLFLVLGLLVFVFVVQRLGIVAKVTEAAGRMGGAVAVMRAADVPDDDKERALQRAAVRMGIAFLDILARSAAAFAVPLACLYGGAVAGLYSPDEAMRAVWDPWFLLFLTALAGLAWRRVR